LVASLFDVAAAIGELAMTFTVWLHPAMVVIKPSATKNAIHFLFIRCFMIMKSNVLPGTQNKRFQKKPGQIALAPAYYTFYFDKLSRT
jgi:hypothetical protein